MLHLDTLERGKRGRGQTDSRKEGELVKGGKDIVVDVEAAVETEQPETPGASPCGVATRGRRETACEGGEGVGGDGTATEIEGEQAVEGAKVGNVVVAQVDAVWEGDQGDEGKIWRVWYLLEEREVGV